MNCCNAFGTCHQGNGCAARAQATPSTTGAPTTGPNPFAVSALPAELTTDQDEEDELGQMLVQMLVTYVSIFVVAFFVGLAVGRSF